MVQEMRKRRIRVVAIAAVSLCIFLAVSAIGTVAVGCSHHTQIFVGFWPWVTVGEDFGQGWTIQEFHPIAFAVTLAVSILVGWASFSVLENLTEAIKRNRTST